MTEIIVNFNTATKGNLIPEGEENKVEVGQVKQKEGKESGVAYLNWQFGVIGGQHAGRNLFMKTSLQPHALWKLQQLLKALGLPCTGKVPIDLDQLAGRRLFVTVRHQEFEGRTTEEISSFRVCA